MKSGTALNAFAEFPWSESIPNASNALKTQLTTLPLNSAILDATKTQL